MRRVVEDYWLPATHDGLPIRDVNADLGTRGFRPPKGTRTYRRCTVTEERKGEQVQCDKVALVAWEQRHDPRRHKGKCPGHGGPK